MKIFKATIDMRLMDAFREKALSLGANPDEITTLREYKSDVPVQLMYRGTRVGLVNAVHADVEFLIDDRNERRALFELSPFVVKGSDRLKKMTVRDATGLFDTGYRPPVISAE